MPVNQSPIHTTPMAATDGRLFLRDREVDEAAALIRAAARTLDRLVGSATARSGLLSAELDILIELHDRSVGDVSRLRVSLGAPKQSLMRNLALLEAKGLIKRRIASADRRRRIVELTEAGLELAGAAVDQRRDMLRQVLIAAGPEAALGARRFLEGVIARDSKPRDSKR
ncbi:MarR family transcriptional regulator [bacterium]|nr:MarR family transcriptional regulator [bacterium]